MFFFPIIICGIPKGKLGLLYCAAWLAFAFGILYLFLPVIAPAQTPELHAAMEQVDMAAANTFTLPNIFPIALFGIGIILILYVLFKKREIVSS